MRFGSLQGSVSRLLCQREEEVINNPVEGRDRKPLEKLREGGNQEKRRQEKRGRKKTERKMGRGSSGSGDGGKEVA